MDGIYGSGAGAALVAVLSAGLVGWAVFGGMLVEAWGMNHISLFSGQGGFDLAAQWMDWNNIAHCEINPFCLQILKYYWPNAKTHTDIKTTDFTIYRGKCDIVTGGFPCQPYSVAGQRKGNEDDRHLWPHMLRAIQEIQPTWVVGENVPGLINWNGGLVFDEVQADLEAAGYEVIPFILPAASVNAPHKRERIWFVAYATSRGQSGRRWRSSRVKGNENNEAIGTNVFSQIEGLCSIGIIANPNNNGFNGTENGQSYSQRNDSNEAGKDTAFKFEGCSDKTTRNVTNTESERLQGTRDSRILCKEICYEKPTFNRGYSSAGNWQNFPTQSPVCSGNDGISSRLDGITFSKWRNESIKAAGNAIVPQDKFIEPPFSILDTRQGNWQQRKKQWKKLGIESEVGRSATTFNMKEWTDLKVPKGNTGLSDTSIFDPALCEVIYHWFCENGGTILEPFAGGSVRGIVANYLGYKYTGIDIREEQIKSNIEQGIKINGALNLPTWICGDSNILIDTIDEKFDFIFSCPPYADLEVYSNLPGDISNMNYQNFILAYQSIIKKSCSKLKKGCFACFVIGEVRDKKGNYIGFIPDTINCFKNCGMNFYNEAILINTVATASIRANGNMKSKKLVKVHQNVLVFKKD